MTNATDSSRGGPRGPAGSRIRVGLLTSLSLLLGLLFAPQAPGAPQIEPAPPDTADIVGAVSLSGSGEVLPAPRRPIRVGEYLRFSVRYGVISAGDAILEIPEVKM